MIISNVLGDSIGEIELVDSMGSDLSVVNSARISYGGESEEMTTQDEKLVNYLAKNNHSSPFRHAFISFRIKAPEMVMRQWYKHVIGCSWSSPEFHNHGWNEISGRYKEMPPQFYVPPTLRKQSTDNKQVSEGLSLTFCIITPIGLIPYVGIISSLASVVIVIVLMKQLTDAGVALANSRGQ